MNSVQYLVIDGMLSGTGIRDGVEGGYLEPDQLGLPSDLCAAISEWVDRYSEAHFVQYEDAAEVQELDRMGIDLSRLIRAELPEAKVGYFSSAKMLEMPIV